MKSEHRLYLIMSFCLIMLNPLAIDIYVPAVPALVDALHATTEQVKFTIPLFIAMMGICQLIAGPLSDRLGRGGIVIIGIILSMIGASIAYAADTIDTLYIARILQGIGCGCGAVTAMAIVRDLFSAKEAGRWISYLNGVIGVIPAIAPLIGSALMAQWGWRSNFAFLVIAMLPVLLLSLWAFRGGRYESMVEKGTPSRLMDDLSSILLDKNFLFFTCLNLVGISAILVYVTQAPILTIVDASMSEMRFAMLFAANACLVVVFNFLAPKVVKQFGAIQTIMAGVTLCLLSAIFIEFNAQSGPYWFFMSYGIATIGMSLFIGTSSGLALAPFKHCAGSSAAIMGALKMVGACLLSGLISLTVFSAQEKVALALSLLVPFCIGLYIHRTYFRVLESESYS
ncbi:MFS transporter [Algicola sagamiensis]|uniref:MFS transporter n=1 Tax=Algicola sagamiensis TaxID=163869 RepID=UPI00036CE763|nr:MFS transporter [Algicola sagamiensis]